MGWSEVVWGSGVGELGWGGWIARLVLQRFEFWRGTSPLAE